MERNIRAVPGVENGSSYLASNGLRKVTEFFDSFSRFRPKLLDQHEAPIVTRGAIRVRDPATAQHHLELRTLRRHCRKDGPR